MIICYYKMIICDYFITIYYCSMYKHCSDDLQLFYGYM